MTASHLFRSAVWLLAAAALVGCDGDRTGDRDGQADNGGHSHVRYGPGRKLAVLANQEIAESSGMAASRLADGVFWTHNDSGDSPRVFAVNLVGEHLATLHVDGAANRDWEDMASFELAGVSYLLLADIGDNANRHPHCTLYFVAEPAIDESALPVDIRRPVAATATFVYPDGPQDCESVAVAADPADDATALTVYLINKRGAYRRTVYRLVIADVLAPAAGPMTAEPVARVAMSQPTGMDISPDGRRAVVTTYLDALQFVRGDGETWADAFGRSGRSIRLPGRKQGEAICFGRDGRTLYLTSEKLPTPLLEVPAALSRQQGQP